MKSRLKIMIPAFFLVFSLGLTSVFVVNSYAGKKDKIRKCKTAIRYLSMARANLMAFSGGTDANRVKAVKHIDIAMDKVRKAIKELKD